jgi:hypothetical protein
MLNVIGSGTATQGQDAFDYAQAYSNSELYEKCMNGVSEVDGQGSEQSKVVYATTYATNCLTQLSEVTKRMFTIYFRSPSYTYVRYLLSGILALLFGSVYISGGTVETEADMTSRVNSLYVILLFTSKFPFSNARARLA